MFSNILTSPSISPISYSDMVAHTRIRQLVDEPLLKTYLQVATDLVENAISQYLLIKQVTWVVSSNRSRMIGPGVSNLPWQFNNFLQQDTFELPRGSSSGQPVISLLAWPDGSGRGSNTIPLTTTLVPGVDFQFENITPYGRIRWLTTPYTNPLTDTMLVNFTSGIGARASDIPPSLLHAVRLIATNLYENRGDQSPEIFTPAVNALLANYTYSYF